MRIDHLPNKLRLCVFDASRDACVRGLVLTCTADVRLRLTLKQAGQNEPEAREFFWRQQLGTLSTDHVGYIAFTLRRLKELAKQLAGLQRDLITRRPTVEITDPVLDVVALMVASPVNRGLSVDVLDRVIPSTLPNDLDAGGALGQLGEQVLAISFGAWGFASIPDTKPILPSVAEPDAADWRLSPASFGMVQVPVVGQDDCETLLPSHEPERIVRAVQLVREPALELSKLRRTKPPGSDLLYRMGRLVDYETQWRPLNHALGRVLYSLTLAPCEAANVAIVDWRRVDESTRRDSTQMSDALVHDERRDRHVDEAMSAAIEELQTGESLMGGGAAVGGGGGAGFGATAALALGYATSTSRGGREVEGDTVQRLADAVAQSSRMVRDLRTTVVVQATQSELETVQTRTVRNHNHSHALTILYYEVVRHYLLTTRAVRERDVIFVKQPLLAFTPEVVHRHRETLRRRLLDPALAAGFDGYGAPDVPPLEIKRLYIEVTSGNDGHYTVPGRVEFRILTRDGVKKWVLDGAYYEQTISGDPADLFGAAGGPVVFNFIVDRTSPRPDGAWKPGEGGLPLALADIIELGVTFDTQGDGDGRNKWMIDGLEVRALVGPVGRETDLELVTLVDRSGLQHLFPNDSDLFFASHAAQAHRAEAAGARARMDAWNALVEHIQAHALHYNQVLWAEQDPQERLLELEHYPYPPTDPRGSLADFIDNRLLGIQGDTMAFAIGPARPIDVDQIRPDERIVSLPTRGSFAEVALSHCNASEVIDDTRFWDWQRSPCIDNPPEIGGITVGSRFQNALFQSPTAMPQSALSIQDPENAPAPSGLAALLDQATKADIFRDMSGRTELAGVLTELVKAAGQVEATRIQAISDVGRAKEAQRSPCAGTGAPGSASAPAAPSGTAAPIAPTQASVTPVGAPASGGTGPDSTDSTTPDRGTPTTEHHPRTRTTREETEETPTTGPFLHVNVYDHLDRPLVGRYVVQVQREPSHGELFRVGWTDRTNNCFVRLWPDLRPDELLRVQLIASELQLVDYRTAELQALISAHGLAELHPSLVRLRQPIMAAMDVRLSASDLDTYLIEAKLQGHPINVRIELHGDLQANLQRAIREQVGGAIRQILSVQVEEVLTGTVGGTAGVAVAAELRVMLARNTLVLTHGEGSSRSVPGSGDP